MNHLRRQRAIRRVTFVGLASLLFVTACGSSESTEEPDVMFAQMMIPHHEQAIELADLALNPTANADIMPEAPSLSDGLKQLCPPLPIKAGGDEAVCSLNTSVKVVTNKKMPSPLQRMTRPPVSPLAVMGVTPQANFLLTLTSLYAKVGMRQQ